MVTARGRRRCRTPCYRVPKWVLISSPRCRYARGPRRAVQLLVPMGSSGRAGLEEQGERSQVAPRTWETPLFPSSVPAEGRAYPVPRMVPPEEHMTGMPSPEFVVRRRWRLASHRDSSLGDAESGAGTLHVRIREDPEGKPLDDPARVASKPDAELHSASCELFSRSRNKLLDFKSTVIIVNLSCRNDLNRR